MTTGSGHSCRLHTAVEATVVGISLLLIWGFSVQILPPWRVHLFSHPIWQQEGQSSQRLPPPRTQCPHSTPSCWAHLIHQFKTLEEPWQKQENFSLSPGEKVKDVPHSFSAGPLACLPLSSSLFLGPSVYSGRPCLCIILSSPSSPPPSTLCINTPPVQFYVAVF